LIVINKSHAKIFILKEHYMKYLLSLVCLSLAFGLRAENTNVCDALIASKTVPEDQIKKCLEKKGKSEYYLGQVGKAQNEPQAQDESLTGKKALELESKIFYEKDLLAEGFGMPFISIRIDYRKKPYKESRMTKGDAMCRQFGYEKVIKSIFSAEMPYYMADKKALIIDTAIFGSEKKEPELYLDEKQKYQVRRYVEVTCAKRKNTKDDAGELDSLNEVIVLQK
jgi:hypothetical protein